MAPDDQLVEVDGLLRAEAMEPEVVEDEQVGREEASKTFSAEWSTRACAISRK